MYDHMHVLVLSTVHYASMPYFYDVALWYLLPPYANSGMEFS